jgi:two-component system, cell cycle sensor histidine kinase and response regulator CckA
MVIWDRGKERGAVGNGRGSSPAGPDEGGERAEDASYRLELRLLGTALDAAANAVVITDRDGVIRWMNRAFCKRTGYSRDEALGRRPGELIGSGEHDAAFFRRFWETILAGRVWRGRMVNRRKDGTLFAEEQTVTPVRDASGRITHFIAVKVDVEKWEAASRKIQFQAELLDAVGQAVIATDLEGLVTYWNRAAEELFGWTADEALGRQTVELTTPESSWGDAEEVMERLRQGKSWTGEFPLRRKDGSIFHGLVTDSPIRDDDGRLVGIIGVTTDLTERRELEARLRQGEKMEAIGRLAGGVAHDFNNLLTAIWGRAQVLQEDLPPDSAPLREEVRGILSEVQRAARLTRQLLAFSRHSEVREETLDLRTLMQEMVSLLRRLIPSRIDLDLDVPRDPVRVRGDPSQLEQVVLNLVVNASDAVPEEGRITIRLARQPLSAEDPEATEWPLHPGEYAVLSVQDTGVGMSPEVLDRIFEPFFTTKPEGEGTGLGLSTVFGIVRQGRGWIHATSRPGRGSTFRVLLPLVEEASPEARVREAGARAGVSSGPDPAATESATGALSASNPSDIHAGALSNGAAGAGPSVLVVDDNASILRVAQRALERGGYTGLCAGSGRQALEMVRLHGPDVGLILSDVVMPDMGAAGLLDALRQGFPRIPVVLMSGHAETEIPDSVRRQAAGFLPKPFGMEDVIRAVGSALRT